MADNRTSINDLTREETSASVEPAFPYRVDRSVLTSLVENLCPWHWHNEVELFFMESGRLRCALPGESLDFGPGDVGFVNANVLHMTQGLDPEPCVQQTHIFLPRLVAGAAGSAIERKYVQPLLMNREAKLIRVPADRPEAAAMRGCMARAWDASHRGEPGYEIAVRGEMSALWLALLPFAPRVGTRRGSVDDERVKAMLRYIDANYAERLTLADIAASAKVGPREGSRCFHRQLGTTPYEYLLSCRIDRAGELLRGTDRAVTDIALSCGFASASYFGKLFREKLGMSPLEYRRAQGE